MFFTQRAGQNERLIKAPLAQPFNVQRNRDNDVKGIQVLIGKIETSQKGRQSGAGGHVASILELVDGLENDAVVSDCGAGGCEPGFIFQTISAQMIPRRRVGKDYAADRTEAARDKGDLT